MRRLIASLAVVQLLASTGAALAFTTVDQADRFVGLVEGKKLTRLGIQLVVGRDGTITGRAFGRQVTGSWDWSDDGYFCREMSFGQRAIPRNCQQVLVNGTTVRFIADRGAGDTADLQLR